MTQISIIEAPSGLGLQNRGVENLGHRLLQLGLALALQRRVVATVPPPPASGTIDTGTGVLNAEESIAYSRELADVIEAVFEKDEFAQILGGDCSIMMGSALAARRRGRYGLLSIDGNADYFQPAANPNGEAASMDLAFATGRGPRSLSDLDGLGPSFREEDVVMFGWRDHDDQAEYGSQPLPNAMGSFDLPTIRKLGFNHCASSAITRRSNAPTDGIFVHLDADVLDDAIMPAVDYRIPSGLSLEEIESLLSAALASGRVIGLEVTIYNPTLDRDGSSGEALMGLLTRAFGR